MRRELDSLSLFVALATAWAISAPAAAQVCGSALGACLVPHNSPGCDDEACCNLVCGADPLCCDNTWDADCASTADISCIGLCGASVSGDCFVAHFNPACDDTLCCETVCAADSFCCTTHWDTACAFSASLNCAGGGAFACGDPGSGDCYVPHGNPACEDTACCTAICKVDPTCCSATWDLICASLAAQTCIGGCAPICPTNSINEIEACGESLNDPCYFPSPVPSLQTLPCEAVACGRLVLFTSPALQPDIDVWKITLTDSDNDGLTGIRISLASAFNGFACLVPATGCPALGTALAHVNSSLCLDVLGQLACVPPGNYYLVVAPGDWPNVSLSSIECGADNAYTLRALCTENGCGAACDANAGSCFEFHKTVGCNDIACCQATCAQSPSCCLVQWDFDCVDLAIALCAPPPPNDVCATATVVQEGVTAFTTIGAKSEGPAVPAACIEGGGNAAVHDVWFKYRPAKDSVVKFTTCGQVLTFDSGIVIYRGPCNALFFQACDDNASGACLPPTASSVNVNVDCGVDYFIRIGGGYGNGVLTISFVTGGPACPMPCPADLNGDGMVGSPDLGILLGAWGGTGPANLDGTGTVGSADLGILLGAWGPCP